MTDKKFKKLCGIAEKLAVQSKDHYQVVAIIFDKNRVISTGINTSTRSYPFLKRYFLHGTLHAEIASIIPIIHNDNISGLDIFVYRTTKNNTVGFAKPCPMCVRALYDIGKIKNAYWTTNNGGWDDGRISEMHEEVMELNHNCRYLYNGNIARFEKEIN